MLQRRMARALGFAMHVTSANLPLAPALCVRCASPFSLLAFVATAKSRHGRSDMMRVQCVVLCCHGVQSCVHLATHRFGAQFELPFRVRTVMFASMSMITTLERCVRAVLCRMLTIAVL